MKLFLLVLCLSLSACASHVPPNLNPEATRAWYGTQIIKALDHVRDAVDDAHHTTPPLVDAGTDLKVVQWHQTAVTIVHEAKVGWRNALDASLTGLQANLPPDIWTLIDPYVRLAQSILREVQA